MMAMTFFTPMIRLLPRRQKGPSLLQLFNKSGPSIVIITLVNISIRSHSLFKLLLLPLRSLPHLKIATKK